ncbi:MAG: hypothetical protein OEY59_03750 [Deltaproteobacteria bacterium]|nr:hypothetical protein [Deltaproteobacteria bacterium]
MSASEPISFQKYQDKKKKQEEEPINAVMVWLFCPSCKTIEYSEFTSPAGRAHKCGTQVEEAEVGIDLRAEATLTLHNLEVIEKLIKKNKKNRLFKLSIKHLYDALVMLKHSEEVYLNRLESLYNGQIPPYKGEIEDLKDKLPIKEENKLGLFISEFRFEPHLRFKS